NLIPKEKQQAAAKFVIDNALMTPSWMIDEEILRRIEPVGAIDRIHTAQNSVLNTLLNSARFARLLEQETLDGNLAYSPVDFLGSVRKGVWKELDAPQVKIDAYRRALQHSYLEAVNRKLNPTPAAAAATPFGGQAPGGGRGGQVRGQSSMDEKPMYRTE